MERRYFDVTEMRAEPAEDKPRRIVGYAALFNSLSEDLGGFREKIAPGAFSESLTRDDIRALWSHNDAQPLGRTKNGTLRLHENTIGLKVEIDLPDTSWGTDAYASIQRGDVDQMSFGFSVPAEGDSWQDTNRGIVRTLNKVRLYEVSPVAFPAYNSTSVNARDRFGDIPEVPANLRRATGEADTDDSAARARQGSRRKRTLELLEMTE